MESLLILLFLAVKSLMMRRFVSMESIRSQKTSIN
nr:MAG TPA: hypothetical protein [Bacteriophage sp.]